MGSAFLTYLWTLPLFAEGEPAKDAPADPIQIVVQLFPFIIIGFLFYFLMIRPQKREQSRRQEMLDAVKKNDRVVTIGGIYGVVTNVHREADEITVKVDEATNTKLRLTLNSIARVLGNEPESNTANK